MNGDTTLLQYAFLTNPPILETGANATLTLVVSNGGSQIVTCTSIAVTLKPGINAKDLTSDPSSIATQPASGWSAAQNGAIFTLTPTSPDAAKIGQKGLAFVFADLNVNDQPGVTEVRIDEVAASGSHPSDDRTTTLELDKFPAGFSLSPVRATPVGVDYDGSTTIMWQGSPATYTLSYDPDGNGLQTFSVNDIGPFEARNLTNAAGVDFTLTATVRVHGSDEPLIVQKQRHVDVSNPVPTISSFTATFSDKFTSAVSATLAWTTTGRDVQCSLTGFSTQFNPNGHVTVSPDGAPGATYTLTASNANGSASSAIAITWGVPQTPAPIALPSTPQDIAISPDGRRAYVACSQHLAVVDLGAGAVSKAIPWPNGLLLVNVSGDGTRLFLLDVKPYYTILDATTLASLGSLLVAPSPLSPPGSFGLPPRAAAFSADGSLLYLPLLPFSTEGGRIACVSTTAPPSLAATINDVQSICIAVSPDGKTLLAGNATGVSAYATDTGTLLAQLLSDQFFAANLAFTADGTTAYVLSWPGGSSVNVLTPIDVQTLTAGSAATAPTAAPLNTGGLAIAPDQSYLLCGGSFGVYVAEGSPAAFTQTLANSVGQATTDVEITPDGKLTVVAFASNTLMIIPLPTIKDVS